MGAAPCVPGVMVQVRLDGMNEPFWAVGRRNGDHIICIAPIEWFTNHQYDYLSDNLSLNRFDTAFRFAISVTDPHVTIYDHFPIKDFFHTSKERHIPVNPIFENVGSFISVKEGDYWKFKVDWLINQENAVKP